MILIYFGLEHLSFGESIMKEIIVFESKKQLLSELSTLESRQFSSISQTFEHSIIRIASLNLNKKEQQQQQQ